MSDAFCPLCDRAYRYTELNADRIPYKPDLCDVCRTDLTDSIRGHLRTCWRAALEFTRIMRERARLAQKESRQLRDQSEVARAEREASDHAGRDAPDQARNRVRTCAYCNEPLGAVRVPLIAPPFTDFVRVACPSPARAMAARLRLGVLPEAHHWRLVSVSKRPKMSS